MVARESKYIYQRIAKCYGSYILLSNFFLNLFRSNSWDHAPFFTSYTAKGRNWLNPVYSWNKQLAHTPFPKKSNTPITTLRFIRFVAKISVLNPKLPADGQWPGETKESVTFFIWSPLIDRRLKNRTSFFVVLLDLFPISKWKMDSKFLPFHNAFSFSIEICNKNKTYSNSIRYRAAGFSCKLWNTSFVAPFSNWTKKGKEESESVTLIPHPQISPSPRFSQSNVGAKSWYNAKRQAGKRQVKKKYVFFFSDSN